MKSNRIVNLLILGIISLFFASCSVKKNVVVFSASEPYTGNVTVIPNGQSVPDGYVMIGTLSYGDTGFSTNCSLEYEIQDAIETAKSKGASLIYIQSIKAPDLYSTCYRTTFALYKKSVAEPKSKSDKGAMFTSNFVY